jgi:hypothetical protein
MLPVLLLVMREGEGEAGETLMGEVVSSSDDHAASR